MASVIKQFSKTWSGKYPWPLWTNGEKWKAKKGVDFFCSKKNFLNSLYRRVYVQKDLKEVVVPKIDDQAEVEFQYVKKVVKKPAKQTSKKGR